MCSVGYVVVVRQWVLYILLEQFYETKHAAAIVCVCVGGRFVFDRGVWVCAWVGIFISGGNVEIDREMVE